ncbi:MAG TPA: AsmA family protein, partial [bacterium]|nr:AsmA family protein [bacterium]
MKQKSATPSSAPRIPRWLAIVGALLAFLGLATMVAPFFIPWGKVKDEAVAAGSKALGRELAIDKIEVSLFTGVHIRNLRLANAKGGFSDQALFTNADAKVDVNLLSLFTGKLVINSITFVKPQVLSETNARGISNLQGLGGPPEAPGPGDASAQKGLAT